jgi:hypothetical protein
MICVRNKANSRQRWAGRGPGVLYKQDAHDKSPEFGFRPAFLGGYRGSVRSIPTFCRARQTKPISSVGQGPEGRNVQNEPNFGQSAGWTHRSFVRNKANFLRARYPSFPLRLSFHHSYPPPYAGHRRVVGAAGIWWRWRRSALRRAPGPGLAVAFLGQKSRPPTIRPPTGLWGALGGLMIRAGAPENAVFGAGQADMTVSDRHTHNLAA